MGKGSGGGGHTPIEAPESGRSKQQVKILEILSEGEIEGLVDGVKSVYLDKTPIQAENGSYNFNNLEAAYNYGLQDQSVLAGFNTSDKEVSVGVEVKRNTPITRTITDSKVTRIRLTLGVKALFNQNDKGDTNTTSVHLRVTVGEQVRDITINGKYSSQYLRAVIFDNLPQVPFNIKVERITADSTSNRLQNGTVWASYTEIIDTVFSYPNTALVGIKFDSEYFNAIPTRNYEIYGIKVKVPTNYNPKTRTYTDTWDGTFKIAWTNNPAWILYDFLLNKRYGFGQRLGEFNVDKWTLYAIAQYCDGLVPDGFGGKEPRFTCNLWLTEQRSAYDVIHDICSIFRAIPVWTGTYMTFIQDRPSDPVWTYTNANVIDGLFERSYSAQKSRHNIIHVEYLDKNASYETKIEYVSDDNAIRKYGPNVKKVTAFGCTSRGQAHRTGKWILETEKLEKETVTFTVGREGLMHCPGDIIRVADNHYAGTEIGGRVIAINGRKVTLDREISLNGDSFFSYINQQAEHSSIRIGAVDGQVITLDRTPTGLTEQGVWSLSTQSVVSRLYRALGITENENGTYTITALQHEPQKEAIVDNGAHFERTATTKYTPPQITHLDVATGYDGKLYISTEINAGDGVLTYDIRVIKDGKLYQYHRHLTSPNIALDNLPNGEYEVVIYAKNARGQLVSEKSQHFTIDKPPAPTGVRATGGLGEITLEWDWVDDVTQTEIFAAETDDFSTAVKVAKVNARLYSHAVGAKQVRYYWLRHVRGVNNGPFYQEQGLRAESAIDVDEKLENLNAQLKENIVDDIIDTALPARNLEMTKTVSGLNINEYQGAKQVYNTLDNKLYIWDGVKYTDNGIDTNQIRISTQQLMGTLSASQIAAQSITTHHLGASVITADKMAPNSVTTGAIEAGAVRAEHLAAGSVSADSMAIGLGGNLLYNPIFANEAEGWETRGFNHVVDIRNETNNNDSWVSKQQFLPNENLARFKFRCDNPNIEDGGNVFYISTTAPVSKGKSYIFSAYAAGHRCRVKLSVVLRSSTHKYLRQHFSDHANRAFHETLDDADRLSIKFNIPLDSEAVKVSLYIACEKAGNFDNSILFAMRPMLEECSPHATQPSTWQNAGVTAIHGGSIKAKTILTEQLGANIITANEIAAGAVGANHIATKSLTANHIVARSLTANELNIGTLSAISSNIGTVTAGKITGTTIEGNTIKGGTISGTTVSGSTINGATINGGVIKGTVIEGLTVRAENIIGDIIKAYEVSYKSANRETLKFTIPSFSKRRLIFLLPVSILSKGSISASESSSGWHITKWADITIKLNNSVVLTSSNPSENGVVSFHGGFYLAANTTGNVVIDIYNHSRGLANNTKFAFLVFNA